MDMDDAVGVRRPFGRDPGDVVSTDGVVDVMVPKSLWHYLDDRTADVSATLWSLLPRLSSAGMWTPVAGAFAESADLGECRFSAKMLLARRAGSVSAIIVASEWSVTLIGDEAWIDVEWPSDTLAMALEGRSVRFQIDFPFLDRDLIVRGSEPMGIYRRFHCGAGIGGSCYRVV